MYISKAEAADRMNKLGAKGKPFVFVIDFDMDKNVVLPYPVATNSILFKINDLRNYHPLSEAVIHRIELEKEPVPFHYYETAFNYCLEEINFGNSYLLNLTFPTRIHLNLSLQDVFLNSQAKYKLLFDSQFVCFSPETFVQIKNGIISSNPMKGTISANVPNAAQAILNNHKEMGEHHTIVDFIRNDLNMVAKKIRVEKFRYIDRLMTNNGDLLQVSSKIVGVLPSDYPKTIGTLLYQLLPGGSISGAPKKKTLEIIKKAEQYDRGFYTGIFGFFDGKNLDSGVMIRFIEQQGNSLYFKSGGGITSQSDAPSEYQEMIYKVYVPIVPAPALVK